MNPYVDKNVSWQILNNCKRFTKKSWWCRNLFDSLCSNILGIFAAIKLLIYMASLFLVLLGHGSKVFISSFLFFKFLFIYLFNPTSSFPHDLGLTPLILFFLF